MSSNSSEWATPQWLFNLLNNTYLFTLDPCSTDENAKCRKHYTKEENGLVQSWAGERVFVNPPYGKEITAWVKKCFTESKNMAYTNLHLVVALLPARTDTRWFHDYVYGKAEIFFIKGRLKFGDGKGCAPFPSMIAVWNCSHEKYLEMESSITAGKK
jgi:site-specific DNA-methyltransferase (adenine-specific)